MAQLDAGSFVAGNRYQQRFANNMIRHRLVQVVATDTHSVVHRPPTLRQAMRIIAKEFGGDMVRYLEGNSKIITTATEPVLVCR
jgi:tyrosine-protein phosphatase YwqE